jgi:hypothetical protein
MAIIKTGFLIGFFLSTAIYSMVQPVYDSITISRSTIEDKWYEAVWPDTVKSQRFHHYIKDEKTVWVKPAKAGKVLPAVLSLSQRIRSNGTGDISKCFIPRHSINFYKGGKIVRYLLVCFECDGVRFSDEPAKAFIKSIETRDKQMSELKKLFKDLL